VAPPAGDGEPRTAGGRAPQIAVVGGGEHEARLLGVAEEVGRRLAEAGVIVVCGGLGGVMEATCRGARAAGGLTVGILPGTDATAANEFVDVVLPTGLGEARDAVVARGGEALIAIGGAYGTLAEIALALKAGTPVVGLDTWELGGSSADPDPIERAGSAAEAVASALELTRSRASRRVGR
jgi:uncharacterized protein (TIGR00725 family)